jgi:hypothetical protein
VQEPYIWNRGPVPTLSKTHVSVSGPGNNPAKTAQVGFLAGSGTKPNRTACENPDPLLTLIIREVSAPDSDQQNGISGRCNCTVLDLARSMLNHAGMPNSSGPKLCPQQSTSGKDFLPELSPIRHLSQDACGRSPIYPILELSAP